MIKIQSKTHYTEMILYRGKRGEIYLETKNSKQAEVHVKPFSTWPYISLLETCFLKKDIKLLLKASNIIRKLQQGLLQFYSCTYVQLILRK